jgi:linoleoyl-CoA desaturase
MAQVNIRFIDKDKERARFFSTVRQRVDAYFKENKRSKHYNAEMVVKTVILLSTYILPFVALLAFHPGPGVSVILWSLMGFSLAGIGMSVMHDANHGAYSSSSKVNLWLGHTLNLLGGSVFNWKMQHNLLHHTYTNIISHDYDIQDKAVLRFSPHTRVKWFHKLQFLYAILFYGILTIYWALLKDFMQFSKYRKEGINNNSDRENRILLFKMIADKLLYFFVFLFVPVYLFQIPATQVFAGFITMHFIAGVILTVVFQLAHTVEGTTHPVPDETGTIENNWAVHQMNTTVNFSRQSRLISWYVGGLNFQVEHHLFPTICHVHYPEISEIVKTTAEEFGIPYLENRTFMDAVNSHIETLRRFGRLPDINEALA